jgi:hypothetical protein
MFQDIPAVIRQPGDEIICDTVLAPSPPFTAASALEAVLFRSHCHILLMIGIMILIVPGSEKKYPGRIKKIANHLQECNCWVGE